MSKYNLDYDNSAPCNNNRKYCLLRARSVPDTFHTQTPPRGSRQWVQSHPRFVDKVTGGIRQMKTFAQDCTVTKGQGRM